MRTERTGAWVRIACRAIIEGKTMWASFANGKAPNGGDDERRGGGERKAPACPRSLPKTPRGPCGLRARAPRVCPIGATRGGLALGTPTTRARARHYPRQCRASRPYGAGDWQVPSSEQFPSRQNPLHSVSAEHGLATHVRSAPVEHTRLGLLQSASVVHSGGPQTPVATSQCPLREPPHWVSSLQRGTHREPPQPPSAKQTPSGAPASPESGVAPASPESAEASRRLRRRATWGRLAAGCTAIPRHTRCAERCRNSLGQGNSRARRGHTPRSRGTLRRSSRSRRFPHHRHPRTTKRSSTRARRERAEERRGRSGSAPRTFGDGGSAG